MYGEVERQEGRVKARAQSGPLYDWVARHYPDAAETFDDCYDYYCSEFVKQHRDRVYASPGWPVTALAEAIADIMSRDEAERR